MQVIEKSPERFVLRMEANESLANAIRRSVAEIPVLAVDEVEFYKNDSGLYDEILAHRIGLIPLKMEKTISAKKKIELKLSKTGSCTVYSGDMKGGAEVVYEKMPIVILGEKHKLELLATAVLGKGVEHAKYIPGLCYYKHILEVKSNPEIDSIMQKSKGGAIKAEKKGSKWVCDLNEAEQKQIEDIDKEAIKDSEEILFFIESYGNMPAKDIFTKAIEALEDNLGEFGKSLK